MSNKIALIDYGLGNLFSVARALTFAKADWFFANKPGELKRADKLVLPGVGAFADGMKGLKAKKLDKAIKAEVDKNKPILGICLGMQLMVTTGHEFGTHPGLDLIPGIVEKMSSRAKLPQIGWNEVKLVKSEIPLFKGIADNDWFYFVHSYVVRPKDKTMVAATTNYGDDVFCSVVEYNRIWGTQFHPEKSGPTGLKIYANFVNQV